MGGESSAQGAADPQPSTAGVKKERESVEVPVVKRRVIRLSDVVKALELATERLGDTVRSCATLRSWAAAGRVTPSGQVLTPEAVDAGIKVWLAKRSAATIAPALEAKAADSLPERKPATPQKRRRSVPTRESAATVPTVEEEPDQRGEAAAATPEVPEEPPAAVVESQAAAAAPEAPLADEVAGKPAIAAAATKRQRALKPNRSDEVGKEGRQVEPQEPAIAPEAPLDAIAATPAPVKNGAKRQRAPKAKKANEGSAHERQIEPQASVHAPEAPRADELAETHALSATGAKRQLSPTLVQSNEEGQAHEASRSDEMAETPAPVETDAKRQRHLKPKQSYEESKEERQRAAAVLREMAVARLGEVMQEMYGHMEDVIRSTGPEALGKWQAAAPAMPDAERREFYSRLVHGVQEAVSVPENLCAELFPHQAEGLEWLVSLYVNGLHGILADEMGLGKTIQTLAFLLYLQERKGNIGPHLIVAPKSCLSNWEAEFKRFAPSFAVHVLTGSPEEREVGIAAFQKSVADGKAAACVTNYEQVYRNEYLLKREWQVIVVDEGHRLKNPETVLHSAMKQLQCRMRLLLTGTPLQNGLNELWALLHYLLPELFTCMMDFKAWFANPFKGMPGINEFEIQLQPEEEQQVIARMHALLSPFLLQRLKSDTIADRLPARAEVTLRVPLSAWQVVAYKELEQKTISLMGDDDNATSEQINNAMMQLRKIVLHPYLFQEEHRRDENLYRASGKMEALDRLLMKLFRFDHKVLIFSQFTSLLDVLQEFLEWRSIGFVRLDGKVGHDQRRERIDRFNTDSGVKVFLLSTRAGGLGLNLQTADTVIMFDMDWNPQNDKQAVARVHRFGQTREVRVIRLLTDTPVERHIEGRCQEKLEMEQKIMGAGMFRRQVTSDQRRQALRAMLGLSDADGAGKHDSGCPEATNAGQEVARATPSHAIGDFTSLEDLNQGLARSDAELEAFQSMDVEFWQSAIGQSEGKGNAEVSGARSLQEQLQSCSRLMGPEEVPAGFTGFRGEDVD